MLRLIPSLMALLAMVQLGQAQMSDRSHWPHPMDWLSGAVRDIVKEEEAANAYRDANRLIGEEEWGQAALILEGLYAQDEENRNLAFKLALCLRSVKGRTEEAVPLALQAADGEFPRRYNALDVRERLPSEEALGLALEVLQHTGHYADAAGMAQRIMERYPERDFRHIKAAQAKKDCAFASLCLVNPRDMGIRPSLTLNSPSRDFAPVVSPDGASLYFTSYRNQTGPESKKKGRVYRSDRTEQGWGTPVALDFASPSEDVTTVGVLGVEEALVLHRGRRSEGDVWTARWNEEGELVWGERLEAPILSKHWETAMTERFDGQERIFVSDRPGGQGGRDLYRTVRLPDGSWSAPLNLGSRINTAGEEESPVLSADGRSLVFSSNGHQGMGGFDLFRCVRLDNGSWSEPEHMGHPLNTAGDEVMVSLDASGQSGFLSSSRQGGVDLDIFTVEVYDEPEEALAVFIGEVRQWQDGDVLEVKSVDAGEPIFRVFRARSESGSFVAALPACRQYRFTWMRGMDELQSREEQVACDAAYGTERRIGRLAPFGWEVKAEALTAPGEEGPSEAEAKMDVEEREAMLDADAVEPSVVSVATVINSAKVEPDLAEVPAPSHVFEDNDTPDAATEPTPVTMIEFEAVSATVEFGYGRYLSRSTDQQVADMVEAIMARHAVGEVPVLEIEGSASFVPVKNAQAYKTNAQLAKMRAEKARDAVLRALSAKGLEVGIDFMIVMDWGVAGPQYQGDATAKRAEYRNFQYAKFSLGRQLIERR